jgi:hypothetical protein
MTGGRDLQERIVSLTVNRVRSSGGTYEDKVLVHYIPPMEEGPSYKIKHMEGKV